MSDLHLSFASPKPMDIFGKRWEGYEERLKTNWNAAVTDDDLVLIAGDVSWAMRYEDAKTDLQWIAKLNGKKVLLRGNHDYWWKSISAMRADFPPSVYAVQNDCLRFGNVLIAGTRGWTTPEQNAQQSAEDTKIFLREEQRLALTLEAAAKLRQDGDRLIVMMHYPPFNSRRAPSVFTSQIAAAQADAVVYGHLHGGTGRRDLTLDIDGIPYYLTSLDQIDANPVLIME